MNKIKILATIFCVILILAALFACSDTQNITVSFETNGAGDIAPIKAKAGANLTLPAPTRSFYQFGGWYEEGMTVEFTAQKMPSEDIKLFARWIALSSAIISFESNGGSAVEDIIAEVGSIVSAPVSPIKDGFVFAGWYSDKNLASAYTFSAMPNKNITLYAKWTVDNSKAAISFFGNNKLLNTVYVNKGTAVNINTTAPSLTEYAITPWKDSQNNVFEGEKTVLEGVSLYTDYYSKGLLFDGDTVTGYEGSGENVVLPVSVSKIAENAFMNLSYIKTVSGAENITEIGAYAFFNCVKLRNIDISSVEIIEDGVFNNCRALSQVTLSNELTEIGKYAFANCVVLESVRLHNSLTTINDYAFLSCESLKEFAIPMNLSTLGKGALQNCNALQKLTVDRLNNYFTADSGNNIYNASMTTLLFYQQSGKTETTFTIPSGVITVEENAFLNNKNITHIVLPASLRYAKNILSRFENLSEITFTDLTKITFVAYLYGASNGEDNGKNSSFVSSKLKTVNFTAITSVPNFAFYGMCRLETINGLSSITSIGKSSFAYTSLYTTFNIGKNLANIGEGAFEGSSLEWFTLDALNTAFMLTDNLLYNRADKALIKVHPRVDAFDFHEITNVQSILASAFEGCELLEEIEIPNSVTFVGKKAFQGCISLKKVKMPIEGIITSSVSFDILFGTAPELDCVEISGTPTIIPRNTFSFSGIKNIILPSSVETIGDRAFEGCAKLESVTGLNAKVIGSGAFSDCTSLISLDLGNELETIGSDAFVYSGIISLVFPESLVTIGDNVFWSSSLETISFNDVAASRLENINYWAFRAAKLRGAIVLPASLKHIGDSAFSGAAITSLSFEGTANGDLTIGTFAFDQCGLESISFANASLVSLGYGAFFGNESLVTIDLGDTLKIVGEAAFWGCRFESITLPSSVEEIRLSAFNRNSELSVVNVGSLSGGSSLKSIGQYAFSYCENLSELFIYKQVSSTDEVPSVFLGTDGFPMVFENSAFTVYVPDSCLSVYESVWQNNAVQFFNIERIVGL